MKVKTVIIERMGERKVRERSIFIATMTHTLNIFFSAVLPFVLGFYFARTQNMMFFLFLFIAIFFEMRFEYRGNVLTYKIMRLL